MKPEKVVALLASLSARSKLLNACTAHGGAGCHFDQLKSGGCYFCGPTAGRCREVSLLTSR